MWIDRAAVKEEFKKQQRPQLPAIDSDAQTVKTSCAATKVRLK